MSDTLRLFIALWPDAATRDAIVAIQRSWSWPRDASLTRPERLHLTLHFLGDVERIRVPVLAQALQVGFEPFHITFRKASVWHGGIAALEPDDIPPQLASLHDRLCAALVDAGFATEARAYRPHVTLARRARSATGPSAQELSWHITTPHVLVQSLPGGRGYEPLVQY